MIDPKSVPATKADFAILFTLISALAERLTGEVPVVTKKECSTFPIAAQSSEVKWAKREVLSRLDNPAEYLPISPTGHS